MIKKVVIAAAGKGTRMLHLTKNKPKHLIEVKGRPFLAYLFDNIIKAGYKEIILVVGYKAEKFEEFLENYKLSARGCKIQLVNQFKTLEKGKYGTACPLMAVKKIIGKNNFVMLVGDNLFSARDLASFNIWDKYSYIAGFYHKSPERYGVLIPEKDFLKEIVEKPKKHVGNIINTGLYNFTPKVFNKLDKIKKSPRGEYEITDVISLLAREKKVKVKILKDYWFDFGNPSDIIKISRFLNKNGSHRIATKKSTEDIRRS